jgi:AbrB family looped-hinge helix DNA binding protein
LLSFWKWHILFAMIALGPMKAKRSATMELAKITTRGQITIPIEIRRKLGVKDGDKVIFIEENGRIIMENAAMIALKNAQTAFAGEARRLGLETEQDVVNMVKDMRHEIQQSSNARNG